MYEGFNWRRVLAFIPVVIALALLTVNGSHFMPRYLVRPIGLFLFLSLFLNHYHYSLPRWKLASRPLSPKFRFVLSLLSGAAIAIIGVFWLHWQFPHQVLPYFAFLLILEAIFVLLLPVRPLPK
jgi:hypothetical protein